MTFSWSPLAPTLRNGAITGYSLSCVPDVGGGNTITVQYTAAGTFTLGGFTPATSYNCFISASNSRGSGPAAYIINTTLEAREWRCLHKYYSGKVDTLVYIQQIPFHQLIIYRTCFRPFDWAISWRQTTYYTNFLSISSFSHSSPYWWKTSCATSR